MIDSVRHGGPRAAESLLELGPCGHLPAELGLVGSFAVELRTIGEGVELALQDLQRILDEHELRTSQPGLGGNAVLEFGQQAARLAVEEQVRRQPDVSLELKLGDCVEPRGRTGMAGDEDEVTRGRARRRPRKPVAGDKRAAAVVYADEGQVQVESREHEVVWIATEERCVELGSEHEPDVLEPAIAVEVVLATVIQRDHFASHAIVLRAFTLDDGEHRLTRGAEPVALRPLGSRRHSVGHIGDCGELVQLHAGTASLVRRGLCIESGFEQLRLLGRKCLDTRDGAVVVRHDEA